jgi:hypothetical protein
MFINSQRVPSPPDVRIQLCIVKFHARFGEVKCSPPRNAGQSKGERQANEVTDSYDNEGFAKAVERFLLHEDAGSFTN